MAPAPTHQACPAAPGYVHHVLGRVARTVQPNRQVAAARGAVFALVVNPLKSIFLFLRKLKLSRNHASIVQRLINFCISRAEQFRQVDSVTVLANTVVFPVPALRGYDTLPGLRGVARPLPVCVRAVPPVQVRRLPEFERALCQRLLVHLHTKARAIRDPMPCAL